MKNTLLTTLFDFLATHPGAKIRNIHRRGTPDGLKEFCDIRLGYGAGAKVLARGVRFSLTLPQIMTITLLECPHASLTFYDGSLGYEAHVCPKCGKYFDHTGEHPADEWSKEFITTKNTP